jgi:alpha-tubulin suppressor-like RCC1 family protein
MTGIAAGASFGMALGSDGTVYAWGDNSQGELGNGGTTNYPVAGQVTVANTAPLGGPGSGIAPMTAVAAGASFGMALGSDGTVYAWGDNAEGQGGSGNLNSPHYSAGQVTVPNTAPLGGPLSGTYPVTAIAAGAYFGMAVTSDGYAWAWGDNSDGELGSGDSAAFTTSAGLVTLPDTGALTGVTGIAAGGLHGMATQGCEPLWAWGDDEFGQLSIGTFPSQGNTYRATEVIELLIPGN